MRRFKIEYAAALGLGLCVVLVSQRASAVPLAIDRTRRTIDVSQECPSATQTAAMTQNLAYNAGGLNLAAVDGRFTFVLSTSDRLRQRAHNNALELSWFNFVPGDADYNTNMDPARQLIRAYVMARCGLPATQGDNHLYQVPQGAALANFITFAMGHGGAENRVATGYDLVGNGEREAILMYAATRIKFDLTPTIVARQRICLTYVNVESRPGCVREQAAPDRPTAWLGYLYEGLNRVSYTGHEFWMMYSVPDYRAKVYFTNGTQVVGGQAVDVFVMRRPLGAFDTWNDPGGVTLNYPPPGVGMANSPYRFERLLDAQNNQVFHQARFRAYLNQYHPRVISFREIN
jgi:hypothetical protein